MADQHSTVLPAGDHTPPGTPRTIAVLAALAAALIVTLTAAAMWLSYEHLHDVAHTHGLRDATRAWAWPATVDLFIAAGELLILRASLARTVDWWAIALTAVGSLGSIALNIAGVGSGAAALDYVVAAVPPVVSLLAFGALMNQLYRLLSRRPVAPSVPVGVPVVERADTPPLPAAPPAAPARRPAVNPVFRAPELEAAAFDDDAPEPDDDQDDEPETPVAYTDPRCHAVRPLYDAGYRPGTGTMRTAIVEAGYDRPADSVIRGTIRTEIEAREPDLASLPQETTPLRRGA